MHIYELDFTYPNMKHSIFVYRNTDKKKFIKGYWILYRERRARSQPAFVSRKPLKSHVCFITAHNNTTKYMFKFKNL